MADNSKIIEKIRKLMALARSPNANEAAAALEKAMSLMAEHGIDQAELDLASIGSSQAEDVISTAFRSPFWLALLRSKIAAAFGVRSVVDHSGPRLRLVFYGARDRASLAAYAFVVLGRQARAARKTYFDGQRKRIKRATRIARADHFAEMWVVSATRLLSRLVVSPDEHALVDLWQGREYPDLVPAEARSARHVNGAGLAAEAGMIAGMDARLDVPVGGEARAPVAIGHG